VSAVTEPASEPETQGERPEDRAGRWTVLRMILWSADYLTRKGVEHGRLDAEHLLAHALGTTRLELYLEFDRPLDAGEIAAYKPLLLRRARREPLQYVTGRAAFRELELAVDPRVLIPRPETEVLVDVVLEWARRRAGAQPDLELLDLGTGSGCIALALLGEGPFRRAVATDASRDALTVAAANAHAQGAADRIELRAGALWEPLAAGEEFDVIVSNPPYVADVEAVELEPEVRDWEPASALFAGPRGVELLEVIAAGAADRLRPEGLLALEVGLGQADAVADRLRATGDFAAPSIRRDLTGRPRIVTAVRG
jgi:release factor glutamine methyltransferase